MGPDSKWYDGFLYGFFFDPFERTARDLMGAWVPDGARVLDVCCGTGALALALAPRCARVVGVDRSGPMIARARKMAGRSRVSNVEFIQGDATDLVRVAPGPHDVAAVALATHEMPRDTARQVIRSMAHVADTLILSDLAVPQPANPRGLINSAMERFIAGRENYRLYRDYADKGGLVALAQEAGVTLVDTAMDPSRTRLFVLAR